MSYIYPIQHGAIVKNSNCGGLQPMAHELSDGELAVNSNDGRIYVIKANGYITCVSDTYDTKSYSATAISTLENMCKTLQHQVLLLEQQIAELTKRLPPKTWLEEAGTDMEKL